MDEFDQSEPVNEQGIDYSEGSQLVKLSGSGYLSINPEFAPYKSGIMTTGRFHILYCHPQHGTATFYIEQDDNLIWKSDIKPDWVAQEFIDMIGSKIEGQE